MQDTVTGSRNGHPAGSARPELTDGIALLHPEDAVMNAMLDGWTRQQRARRLSADTAEDRCRIVRRFAESAGEYPWNWTAAHVDEWSTALQAEYGRSLPSCRGLPRRSKITWSTSGRGSSIMTLIVRPG